MRLRLTILISVLGFLLAATGIAQSLGGSTNGEIIAEELSIAWKALAGIGSAFGALLVFLAFEAWSSLKRLTTETVPTLAADLKAHAATSSTRFDALERDIAVMSKRLDEAGK